MPRNISILLALILVLTVATAHGINRQHLAFRPASATTGGLLAGVSTTGPIDSQLYVWDDRRADWIITDAPAILKTAHVDLPDDPSAPVRLNWEVLTSIAYQMKYYEEVEMEMFAPVFNDALKSLAGREVIIEGFIIPFEADGLIALSANPYAACFFCGKASPASVISMYPKKKGQRYKMDDYRAFRGTLRLNHNDPNEFYYILDDAQPSRQAVPANR